jgi:hypothetical protein
MKKDLLKEQRILQSKALKLVKTLKLEEVAGETGEFKLVGSAVYGLMTWRDIDADIITKGLPKDACYWRLVRYLFSLEGTKSLFLADNRKRVEQNRPRSMYIGFYYIDEEKMSGNLICDY